MADVLNNLAVAYATMGNHREAIARCKEAAGLLGNEDAARHTQCLINMGTCIAEGGQYARAVEVFEEALAVARGAAILKEEAECYLNIGAACARLGQMERASETLGAGVRLVLKTGDKRLHACFLHSLGCVYLHDGKTLLGIQLFDEAYEEAKSLKDDDLCVLTLTCLKTAHTRMGDAFKASNCVHLMQEHFPEARTRFIAQVCSPAPPPERECPPLIGALANNERA